MTIERWGLEPPTTTAAPTTTTTPATTTTVATKVLGTQTAAMAKTGQSVAMTLLGGLALILLGAGVYTTGRKRRNE